MNTTPENVLDESLMQAKVVHAQLLIRTNTPDIVCKILDIYMVGLEIRTMQAGEFKLLVQLDMEDLFTGSHFPRMTKFHDISRFFHKFPGIIFFFFNVASIYLWVKCSHFLL